MSEVLVQRSRTGWDVVIGVLLMLVGLGLVVNGAVGTALSVLFIGWLLVAVGLLGVVGALFRIGKDGFWSALLGGGLVGVLGVMVLTHPSATAVTLTLLAGLVFLVSGVLRLIASAQEPDNRFALLLTGVVSAVLGLVVLLNLFDASIVLLGILLGVQLLADGLAMVLIGRMHVVEAAPAHRQPPVMHG
jgi:uncharacterized membrane protein HdeD (DUF308 family)